jgi:hypothetical protein
MKKHFLLSILLALALLPALSSNAMAADEDANLTRVVVVGNKVNVRSGPGTNSKVLAQANAGDMFIVETDGKDDPEWYAIRRSERGPSVNGVAYIAARYTLNPLISLSGENVIAAATGLSIDRILSEAFELSTDPQDKAQAAAVLVGLPWDSQSESRVIYEAPNEKSKVLWEQPADELTARTVIGWDEGGPWGGWLKVRPFGENVTGWVRSEQVEISGRTGNVNHNFTYNFFARAGASFNSVDEVVKKWGKPTSRTSEKYRLFDALDMVRTVLEYPDMRITMEKNETEDGPEGASSYSFSRQGAGIGGFFIGEKWCDRAYIESALGKPVEVRKDDDGQTVLSYEPEDEHFWSLYFTLDGEGLIRTIEYNSWPVD